MLRIALCDDQEYERDKTAALLESYLRARPDLSGRLKTFQSGEALLSQVSAAEGFDIYLLDILMPGLSGIDTGRQLRRMGDKGEIIYLTNTKDFAADSYDVRAFFYLLKPVDQDKLFQILDGAVKKLNRRRGSAIVVNTAEGPRRILLERIQYVERVGRRVRYYCTDGIVDSLTIRVSFREATAPLLDDRRFCSCGPSFVLNFQHVSGINGQAALMSGGQSIMLPRSAAAEFKKAWGSYWLEEADQL